MYREGGYSPAASNLDSLDVVLGGTPVLFIPGNRGSYKQARSIASHGAQLFRMIKTGGGVGEDREEGRQWNSQWWVSQAAASLDFFAVDLNEELAGLHGGTLLEQADYVNEVIRFLLKEYYPSRATGMSSSFTTMPTAVILIGHSMGGFVARTALTRPNYVNGTIHTILTLATPHQAPAAPLDYELTRAYQQVNAFWYHSFYGGGGHHEQSAYNPLGHISLLSISGGDLDKMVPARLSVVDSIVPGTHAMTVFTTDIPFVWTAADHQCIVWCKQVVDVVSRILVKTVDVSVGHRVIGLRERMKVFSDYLKGNTSMDAKLGGSTYLWSVPVSSKIVQFRSPFVILQGKSLAKTHVISVTDQVFDVMENGLVLISNVPCTVRACRPVVGSDTHDCQTMEINYDPVPTSDRSQPAYWRTLLTKKHLDSWTLLFIEQSSIQYNVESAFLSIRDYKKSRDTVQLYAPSIWNWKSQTRIESKTLSKINIMNPQQTLLMLRISFEFNQDCIRESENSPKFQSTVYIYDRLINEGKYRPARSISVLLRGLLTDVSSYQGHQSVDPDDAATTLSLFYNPNCQLDYITVEIDYIGTLSAVFQRFRTAVVLLLFVMAIWIFRSQVMEYTESGRFISFPKALYIHAISEMVPFLACVVVVLFFTDAGIAGWTGIPHSWILLPVFWFWSIGILSVFYSILFVIVRVFSLLAAIIRADVVLRFAHISNYESQKRKRIRQSIILFVLVVMCLTIIPMHFASFVSWTTLLIATVRTSFLHNKLVSFSPLHSSLSDLILAIC